MDRDAFIAAVEAETAGLATAAERGLDAPVTGCPEWDVSELVSHMGRVHRWAIAVLTSPVLERPSFPESDIERGPALIAWLREGAGDLTTTLRRIDPDTDVWAFRGPAKPVWWARRQALETAVHRVDGELAHGRARPVDAALAAVGIAEFLEVFLPRFSGLSDRERTLHLHATDARSEWLIRLGPERASATPEHVKGDAAVRGAASDLFLFVWNRIPLDQLEVIGDPAVAELWATSVRI